MNFARSENILGVNGVRLNKVERDAVQPGKYYVMKHGEGVEQLVYTMEDPTMYLSRGIYDPQVGMPIFLDMDYPAGIADTAAAQTAVQPQPVPEDATFYVVASEGGRRKKTKGRARARAKAKARARKTLKRK